MVAPVVLVVDDDEPGRALVAEDLEGVAARVLHAGDVATALAEARAQTPDLILLDLRLPARPGEPAADHGLDAIAELRAAAGGAPVIVVSSHDSAAAGMRALREGAADYLAKPYAPEQLLAAVARAVKEVRTGRELAYLRAEIDAGGLHVGGSPGMQAVAAAIAAAAPTDATVLIGGETGTGKELVARAVHAASPRAARPFIALNVAAVPRELLESTMFGHERGAFTGAAAAQPGRFELAHGGTLFLDEIGELEPALQPKLLRVLQEGVVERIGGHQPRRLDVRVVAASNRDLAEDVRAGRFRRDLFYRLNVIPIAVPPLRERLGDLRPLLALFLERYARRHGRPLPAVSDGVVEALARHDWPGNIRELEQLAQRLVVLRPPGAPIAPEDLPLEYRYGSLLGDAAAASAASAETAPEPGTVLRQAIETFERDFISKTLARCGGNRTKAARLLGIHPATMFRKLNRHDLE